MRWSASLMTACLVPALASVVLPGAARADQVRPEQPGASPDGSAPKAGAEVATEADLEALPVATFETVIVGSRGEIPEPELPLPVSVITPSPLADARPGLSVAEVFVAVPGISARNRDNFAQDLRLSVRGFGARTAFGVRGVAVVLDGIPLTMADGQAQLDMVDPALLERIEVIRGPAGALYGNAAGGVVYLESAGPETRPGADVAVQVGAFGQRKLMVRAAEERDWGGVTAALSRLTLDGYRARAAVEQTIVQGLGAWRPREGLEVRLVGSFVDAPVADDSGGLTAGELRADPSQAAPNNLTFATGEAVRQAQVGTNLRAQLTEADVVEGHLHYVRRDFVGSIPFRIQDLERNALGGSLTYRSTRPLAGVPARLTAATELRWLDDDRQTYANDAGMPTGPAMVDQDERVASLGTYAQAHVRPASWLGVLAGGRYDALRFQVGDRLLDDGDQSGALSFRAFTGMAGVIGAIGQRVELFANVAESFETPTTTELALRPDGGAGLNEDLDAQRARSYELGARGRWQRLGAETSAYRVQLRDELVPFEDATGRTFYRNAGRSHRTGVESAGTLDLPAQLVLRVAYTWMRARFDRYEVGGVDLAGHAVPGLPPHQIGAQVTWGGADGPFAGADAEYLHGTYADDDNTARSPSHVLVGARAGYRGQRARVRYQLHLGVANLLDEVYADNLRINAVGGRYYEPGMPRYVYAGAILGWARD